MYMALKCTFLIIFSLFPKPDYKDQNTSPPPPPMPPLTPHPPSLGNLPDPPPPHATAHPPPPADVWGEEEGGGVGVRREGALLRRGRM